MKGGIVILQMLINVTIGVRRQTENGSTLQAILGQLNNLSTTKNSEGVLAPAKTT